MTWSGFINDSRTDALEAVRNGKKMELAGDSSVSDFTVNDEGWCRGNVGLWSKKTAADLKIGISY